MSLIPNNQRKKRTNMFLLRGCVSVSLWFTVAFIVSCLMVSDTPVCNESAGIIRLSAGNANSFFCSSESLGKMECRLSVTKLSVLSESDSTGLMFAFGFCGFAAAGAGLGFSILNCTGTEYLHRTVFPLSFAGIQSGIALMTSKAAVSIEASRWRTILGEDIEPSRSTMNCITTTPSFPAFWPNPGISGSVSGSS